MAKNWPPASADQTIRIWDVASRKCLDVLRGHRQEVWRLALLPDDKTLVSGGKDGTVCFWDTSVTHPHQSRITMPEKVVDWCFPPENQSVLTLDLQGQVARRSGPAFRQQEPLLDVGTNFISDSWNNVFSQRRTLPGVRLDQRRHPGLGRIPPGSVASVDEYNGCS